MSAQPLRVLHVLWSGEIGGQERAVNALIRAQLEDPSIAPALLYGRGGGPHHEEAMSLGCPVEAAELPSGRALHRLGSLTRSMSGYDLHHFHSAEPLLMLASLRARDARRVYTHRAGATEYPARRRARYLVVRGLLRRFDAVSGGTGHAADAASQLFGIERDEIHVTYNSVEPAALTPTKDAGDVRASLGLTANAPVVGTIARLREWKRIERLIEALADLDLPEARLLIVGDGPDRARLQEIAAARQVESRVIFAGWQPHPGDMLQAMDAFCMPSSGAESFGNALVEAMAVGLPTVVFADGGGMVEHIEDGVSGYVVSSQDELARKLRGLLSDRARAGEIGAAGRALALGRYTPAASAAAYTALYEKALGR